MKQRGPSWTITSRKFYTHKETTPGPGSYTFNSTLTGPNFKIGTSLRQSLQEKTTSPGPGTYSPSKLPSSIGSIYMPTSERSNITKPDAIPGPGTYSSSLKPDGPYYSLRGRAEYNKNANIVPGPGNYNPNYDSALEKSPGCKLGQSKKGIVYSSSSTPGPGNYNPSNIAASPSINFGTSRRSESLNNGIPGPGSYSIKEEKLGYAFSMAPRRNHITKQGTPGPGSYQWDIKKTSPTYSISKSDRKNLIEKGSTPGPAAYSPDLLNIYTNTQSGHFGTASRFKPETKKLVPGPGSYDPLLPDSKISFSLRSRPSEKFKETVPGPGQYSPNTSFVMESVPNFGMTKSPKTFESGLEKNLKDTPAPGSYINQSSLSGPKWGFGSSSRSIQKSTNHPGPGTYEIV